MSVDLRVVAATHRDLDDMVAEGSFRHDLFARHELADLVVEREIRDGDFHRHIEEPSIAPHEARADG